MQLISLFLKTEWIALKPFFPNNLFSSKTISWFNLLSTEKLMASDMKQLLKSFHLNAWLSVAAREGQDLVIANTSDKSVLIKWERPFVGKLP